MERETQSRVPFLDLMIGTNSAWRTSTEGRCMVARVYANCDVSGAGLKSGAYIKLSAVVGAAIVTTTVETAAVVSAPPEANVRINIARIIVAGIIAIGRVSVGRTGIRIARTGVRIARSVGATVVARLTTGVGPRGAVSAPGIIVALVNRQKRVLTLRGIDGDRVNETEAERRLGSDDRGTTARQQHRTDARRGAGARADGGAGAPTSCGPNRRA